MLSAFINSSGASELKTILPLDILNILTGSLNEDPNTKMNIVVISKRLDMCVI